MEHGWIATHQVVQGPLPAYAGGDGLTDAPTATLQTGMELRVVERSGAWAQIEASNGWTAWVDGGHLAAVTRTLPPDGLRVWDRPDPAAAPVTTAGGGLAVTVLETMTGWAHIQFDNGWSGWVDAAALTAPRGSAGQAPV